MIIKTLLEFLAVLLLIYGFCRESDVISLEQRIKAKLKAGEE